MIRQRHLSLFLLSVLVLVALAGCGGPQSSPESVVQAWIQAAVVEGDCQKAATYYAPFRKDDVWRHCGEQATFRLVRVEIYDMIAERDPFRPGITLVTVKGVIERKQLGEVWHKTNTFETEQIDGKWYFVDE
jgi:hypothetical protein